MVNRQNIKYKKSYIFYQKYYKVEESYPQEAAKFSEVSLWWIIEQDQKDYKSVFSNKMKEIQLISKQTKNLHIFLEHKYNVQVH